jgi:hypothetical protein
MLKAARQARGWSQSRLIHELERQARADEVSVPGRDSLRCMISRWENGRRKPDGVYQTLLAQLYGLSDRDLGLVPDPVWQLPTPPGAQPTVFPFRTRRVGPELLDHLDRVFDVCARADNLAGPRYVGGTVTQQLAMIDELCPHAQGSTQDGLLACGARYAELAGWLHQDAGNLDAALYWSDRAMEYAQELDDPRLVSYILMRKSNVITDAGKAGRALGLVTAALKHPDQLTPRLRAVALRQHAVASALAGESAACERAIDTAMSEVTGASSEPSDEPDLASYCTPSYLAMEAGACWTHLAQPEKAVAALEQGLATCPTSQQRDRGLGLARLASAHASARSPDQACAVGGQAIEVTVKTASARTITELKSLQGRLKPWRRLAPVADLDRAIAEVAS